MSFISGKLRLYRVEYFMLVVFMPSLIAGLHKPVRWRKFSVIDNARCSNITGQGFYAPRLRCITMCNGMDECASVNHNTDTDMCELTDQSPEDLAPAIATEPNWSVIYKDRKVLAIEAWQNSTHIHVHGPLSANYAVDGNRSNTETSDYQLFCAHTAENYSYWGMEFERVAEVDYVLLFFRNSLSLNERNSNLRLLISSTRVDSNNNIGTDCATFVGPPASPAVPVKVTCTQTVTGKFLKIIHNYPSSLTLCEVEVYSTW